MSELNSFFGLKGVPLKIDILKCLGTPDEVCKSIREISKNMKKPMVMQLDNDIAIFDIHMSYDFDLDLKFGVSDE